MTGAEALNMVMARLAGRINTTLRANLLLEMNRLQAQDLEQGDLLPWFLIKVKSDLALTPGDRALAVPTDFLRELEEDVLIEIQDSTGVWNSMTKRTYEDNLVQYDDADTSELPRYYSLVGAQLLTFPIPTVASAVRLRYFAAQPAVADTGTTPTNQWLLQASDLLIAETCVIAASLYVREDADKVMMFQAFAAKARKRINDSNVARAEANLNRTMG